MEVQQQHTPSPLMMVPKSEPLSAPATPQPSSGASPRKGAGPGRPLTADRKRPYPCNLCPSRFGSKMELEEHQNSHTGQKPFECDVCKARFNRRSTLWNHKRIHSDAKPFVCPVCEMTFKWKNSLKCHKEMHLRKNESGGLDLEQLRQLTYASAAKRKSGGGEGHTTKKRKQSGGGGGQSTVKTEDNGCVGGTSPAPPVQLHLQQSVSIAPPSGSSLLQQALQSAQVHAIPDLQGVTAAVAVVPPPPNSSSLSSTEPPPDPAPLHYVSSHQLHLADIKTEVIIIVNHSLTTGFSSCSIFCLHRTVICTHRRRFPLSSTFAC